MYKAEVLLDSINPSGSRLTTLRVTFPRIILAEMNTHRVFSRNVASSRAMSVKSRIQHVEDHGFFPEVFGKDQRGMSATFSLGEQETTEALITWREAMASAVWFAKRLNNLGVHKQLANRILEPFCWTTAIISSTEWKNFDRLRDSDKAQPEMQRTAQVMIQARANSTPQRLNVNDWHIPLASDKMVAAGRIARVSYETSGKTEDEDKALAEQLILDGHWSPFEHIAQATWCASGHKHSRNFHPSWIQWRADLDNGTK